MTAARPTMAGFGCRDTISGTGSSCSTSVRRVGPSWAEVTKPGARPSTVGGALDPIDETTFEQLVSDALDALPEELGRLIDNLVVLVEDEHPDEDLYGLYEGIPHVERDDYGGLALPDRITLFRLPLCADCDNMEQLRDEVLVTVVHEVAHHFGIDDERLHDLGWG